MVTTRSPLDLMRRAHALGQRLWPADHASRFSRHDFTQAQLFACLVVRESLRLSYRKAQAFLADVPAWLAELGMARAPDHNTMWRAFAALLKPRKLERALDLLAADAADELRAGLTDKPLAMDATCYEPRHRSGHYDRVCRRLHLKAGEKYGAAATGGKASGKRGERAANAARSRALRRMPKLSLAVAAASHRILAARPLIGAGSDAPDFDPLLFRSVCRAAVRTVVADAGYDSEANHELARAELGVTSFVPASVGRPTDKAPAGPFRRLMRQWFAARSADVPDAYGQRAQSETVHSMMKRNMGDYLRSIRTRRRRREMGLRAVIHNLMLGRADYEGRD